MATIGGVTVSILKGLPAYLKTRVEAWQVAGLDGYGAITLGKGQSEFDSTSVTYCADLATADAHVLSLNALPGTIVSLTDDFGRNFTKILVLAFDYQYQPVIWNGNASAVRVSCSWRMCQT